MSGTTLRRRANPTTPQEKESNLCIGRLTLAAIAESYMAEFVYLAKADAMSAGNSGIRKVSVQNSWESKTRPHRQQDYPDLRPLLPGHLTLQVEDDHR